MRSIHCIWVHTFTFVRVCDEIKTWGKSIQRVQLIGCYSNSYRSSMVFFDNFTFWVKSENFAHGIVGNYFRPGNIIVNARIRRHGRCSLRSVLMFLPCKWLLHSSYHEPKVSLTCASTVRHTIFRFVFFRLLPPPPSPLSLAFSPVFALTLSRGKTLSNLNQTSLVSARLQFEQSFLILSSFRTYLFPLWYN